MGRLAGVDFEAERGEPALENRGVARRRRASRRAGGRAQLGELASKEAEAFALAAGGVVLWRGEPAGEIIGGDPFAPRVRLVGEFGAATARERAARRLEAFARR